MRVGAARAARMKSKKPRLRTDVSFGRQLRAFAEKTETNMEDAVRGIIISLFTSVIAGTPVDEGRARGNWQTSVGSPRSGVVGRLDNTGPVDSPQASRSGRAVAEVESTSLTVKLGDVVWLTNNLPYIGRLEYESWSGQAPHGMVRKNMARIDTIVNEVARGVRTA